ncbi:unnamed protein product [Schistosoma margrebowiei]|uniref:Uncharacterized protein n=1 Tax=Schistosoma margrebowiei TaxID=48269 RepID=A0A183MUU1_9TREM|nr:unnamed protein product [Schistosoma margrebowiei]
MRISLLTDNVTLLKRSYSFNSFRFTITFMISNLHKFDNYE